MRFIDLRSDTVTQPTPAMREAMYKAVLGDDVFDDDPTVKELESLAAALWGKEAALFVTSGTQGNAVAVMAHTRRGDALLMGKGCHIADHEAGSYAMLAGVSPCFAEDENGVLRPDRVRALLHDDSELQVARTGLVCLENSLSNGCVAPVSNLLEIYDIARERGVPVHLDGARLYNAAAALGVPIRDLTKSCDSVTCCLSKGLCAPVGSVVAGSRDFIARAKKIRKALGGGMRQAGVLAAAGIIALTDMTQRLQEDHENAKYLASKIKAFPGIQLDEALVETNMIFFTTTLSQPQIQRFIAGMLERGIKILTAGCVFRYVTHHDVTRQDCDTVLAAMEDCFAKL